MPGVLTEQELLQQAAAGNRNAFAQLYTGWIDPVYNYIFLFTRSSETTEDLVQEIFVKVWEHRERLAALQSFKAYLFRIAKNDLIDYVRHQQVKHKVLQNIERQAAVAHTDTEQQVVYADYYNMAREAIDRLPEKRKLIFRLSTEEGLSYDEIASRLDISKSVVKKQLYAAFDFVRQYLYQQGELSLSVLLVLLLLFP
ncbi:MAG: RNA polymerase sigma-70 factor [Bacteroidetes bacterium]|nr:RNA polymerase sigma-70 factor [Bacteroidota bacterium]